MVIKEGHYRIDLDVVLFPWKLTYKPIGPGHVPKGSFGKVHLAQDTKSRKRMACKLVSSGMQRMFVLGTVFFFLGKYSCFHSTVKGHDFPSRNLCSFMTKAKTYYVLLVQNSMLKTI